MPFQNRPDRKLHVTAVDGGFAITELQQAPYVDSPVQLVTLFELSATELDDLARESTAILTAAQHPSVQAAAKAASDAAVAQVVAEEAAAQAKTKAADAAAAINVQATAPVAPAPVPPAVATPVPVAE